LKKALETTLCILLFEHWRISGYIVFVLFPLILWLIAAFAKQVGISFTLTPLGGLAF